MVLFHLSRENKAISLEPPVKIHCLWQGPAGAERLDIARGGLGIGPPNYGLNQKSCEPNLENYSKIKSSGRELEVGILH